MTATNLPLVLDGFVGREHDVARIERLMTERRLVTVTGPPGIGKTRLATELARLGSTTDRFRDRVWLVLLAPLAQADDIMPALAAGLSLSERPDEDALAGVIRHIGEQAVLLIIDNCEHVLEGSARLAATLLESCRNLRILATSQERLAIAGEQVWPLGGLAVPDRTEAGIDEVAAAPAVQLFVQRAAQALPSFALTIDNAGAVVEVCRSLDGIPLAIELAAARANTMSPADVAGHLDRRFGLLTGGSPAAMPRHQTLKAAVDWSYDLLDAASQAMLRRLSIFSGGACLDAIESVCTGGEVGDAVCLELVNHLVDRSLVVADHPSSGTRYRLLETIRLYGRERLAEAVEVTTTAARHVDWCVALAEAGDNAVVARDQPSWLARLEAERPNLQAAMRWSLDQGPTDAALRIAGALTVFWRMRGRFEEGLSWLSQSLAVAEEADAALRAKAQWGQALMAAMLGRNEDARRGVETSLALWSGLDDPSGTARALLLRGSMQSGRKTAEDIRDLQGAIVMARRAGDGWCLSQALANCGSLYGLTGDRSAGRQVLEEAVTVAEETHDHQCRAFALVSLGHLAVSAGDHGHARRCFEEAIEGAGARSYEITFARKGLFEVALAQGDTRAARRLLEAMPQDAYSLQLDLSGAWGRLELREGHLDAAERHFTDELARLDPASVSGLPALLGLGEVSLGRERADDAERRFTDALVIGRAKGDKAAVAHSLHGLGRALLLAGRYSQAETSLREAMYLRIEIDDRLGITKSFEAMGEALAADDQWDRAARVLGCAAALRSKGGYARLPFEQARHHEVVAKVRSAVGEQAFETAFDQGGALSPDAALKYLTKRRSTRGARPVSGLAALTDAERGVARLVVEGLSNAEIAARLYVALPTVKTHVSRILTKLEVSSRSELISRYPKESF